MHSASKTILLTGQNSILGNYLKKEAEINGWQVLTLEEFQDKSSQTPAVTDVIHCKGETRDESMMTEVNVEYTKALIKHIAELSISSITYISSLSVYGVNFNNNNVDENTTCSPASLYGSTKLAAEKIVQEYAINRNIRFNIVRVGNLVSKENINILSRLKSKSLANTLYLVLKGNELTHIVDPVDIAGYVCYVIGNENIKDSLVNITNDDQDNRLVKLYEIINQVKLPLVLPLIVPHLLRHLTRGMSLRGDIVFCNKKYLMSGYQRRKRIENILTDNFA